MAAILGMCKLEHHMQMRNPRIACSAEHVSNIQLREFNLNFKNSDDIKKSVRHRLYSSMPNQPYHIQADLIWCKGTFKEYVLWDIKKCIFLSSVLVTVNSKPMGHISHDEEQFSSSSMTLVLRND
jgi:hypothetical protein